MSSNGTALLLQSSPLQPGKGDPHEILHAVLEVERHCVDPEAEMQGGFVVDRLVDEPLITYCTCSSLESQTVISYLCLRYNDVTIEQAMEAILNEEQRSIWDADSEFRVLQPAQPGDALCEEVVHHVLHAPWPFWDRDVLQRRWQLPIGASGEEGRALVLRSVRDEGVLPEQTGRVRAVVDKAAFLFRRTNGGKGLELTTCSQLDIGGLVPQWAQEFLGRFASRRAEAWKDQLRNHCLRTAGGKR